MTALRRLALAIALLAAPTAAFAQKEPAAKPAQNTKTQTKKPKAKKAEANKAEAPEKKVKNIDFIKGDEIDGTLQTPGGEDVVANKPPKHTNLIKLRANFIPEILKAAEQL